MGRVRRGCTLQNQFAMRLQGDATSPGLPGLQVRDHPGWEVLTVPTVVVTQVGLEAPGPECVCSFLCSGQVGNLVGCPWIPILGTPRSMSHPDITWALLLQNLLHPTEFRDPSSGVRAPTLSSDLQKAATTELLKNTPCARDLLPTLVQECSWDPQGP